MRLTLSTTQVILSIFVWLVVSFKNIFWWIYYWQLKEYRWDRMRAHLKTYQGKKEVFDLFFFIKILLLFLLVVRLLNFNCLFEIYIFSFGLEAFVGLRQLLARKFKRPDFTLKACMIIATTIGEFFLILIFFKPKLEVFLLSNLLSFLLTAFSVGLWSLPTRVIKNRLIAKAKKKISKFPDLTVIGITGSFGKTSTKEFLKQIFQDKFTTLATLKHQNTPIGVAKQILSDLDQSVEVYIVEMGAYKKGEINSICRLVSPKIGILTGLGVQHLSLFGSLDNLLETKFELVDNLPENGLLVVNGDNEPALKLAKKTQKSKLVCSIENKKADFLATNIQVFRKKVSFEIKKKRQKQKFKAKLLGKHNITNLLMAIAVADYYGVGLEYISRRVAEIKTLSGTMRLLKGIKGTWLVDDTYNSNPQGVLAALDYLAEFEGKSLMIFQPMIELGRQAAKQHQRVLSRAVEVCEAIFLTNRNFYPKAIANFKKADRGKIKVVKSPKKLKLSLQNVLNGETILFEGREAKRYLFEFRK